MNSKHHYLRNRKAYTIRHDGALVRDYLDQSQTEEHSFQRPGTTPVSRRIRALKENVGEGRGSASSQVSDRIINLTTASPMASSAFSKT